MVTEVVRHRLGSRAMVWSYLLLAALGVLFDFGCSGNPGEKYAFGIGGRYNNGYMEFIGRGGNFDRAITELEYVIGKDPFYKDSLTLLGRAYYNKKRYRDAFQMLKRALAVNPKNEIAWIALGLAQLRLGDSARGLESLKGGLTLLARASRDGYKDYKEQWDPNRVVRGALRKAVFYAGKGLVEKRKLIRSSEILLYRVDNELREVRVDQEFEERDN